MGVKWVEGFSDEEVNNMIEYIRQQYVRNGIRRWAIIEKKSNNFIGWTGLKLVKEIINNQTDYYELGYRLIKQYWGQGYATESAYASLEYGFGTMNLDEIYAMTDVRNKDSQNVLTKVGLRFVKSFNYNELEHNWYKIERNEWDCRPTYKFRDR